MTRRSLGDSLPPHLRILEKVPPHNYEILRDTEGMLNRADQPKGVAKLVVFLWPLPTKLQLSASLY